MSMNAVHALPPTQAEMTLTDHLGELRTRILIAVATLTATVLAGFALALPAIAWMKALAPLELLQSLQFVQLTPGEVLLVSVKLALVIGVILASPMLLYQTLMFVLPGLADTERKPVLLTVIFGSVLFACGLWFSSQLVVPSALGFLLAYGQSVAVSQISIASYVDFCTMLMAVTGILFELPLVLMLLASLNLVTSTQLLQQWRVALVAILVAAAVLTPSQDPVTMGIVAAAMTGLYFASLLPIKLMGK